MKGEKGQALPGALIALVVGALILVPFLNYASTGVRATNLLGEIMEEQYSTGAGVEDAMWRVTHDAEFIAATDAAPVTYSTTINNLEVLITVELVSYPGRVYVESNLTRIGDSDTFLFTLSVENVGPSTIYVEGMGDMLPRGFTYVTDSCQDYADNLAFYKHGQQDILLEPTETWVRGRWMLTWEPQSSNHFPEPVYSGETRTQRFRATTTGKSRYNEAWIEAQPNSIGGVSNLKRYDIKAVAGDRIVHASIMAREEPEVLSWQLG